MINDLDFSQSFVFNVFSYNNYKYTDNRQGVKIHYFAYMISGNAKICSDKEILNVSEGDIFYIPKGLKYQSFWYGEPKIELVSLGFRFLPVFNDERYALQNICGDEASKELFLEIAKAHTMSPEQIGIFYTLAAKLMPNMVREANDKNTTLTYNVKRYIESYPESSVSDIAKHFAISESALYLAFQKYSEVSINEYKNNVLMSKAKEMLITSDVSIEELSERLGFSSSSYFRKRFKSYFKITPREMRKQNGI